MKEEMRKPFAIFGFIFFGIEILAGLITGLTYVPWDILAGFFTDKVLIVIFAILWNVAGAAFLWAAYKD